jgi:signal transduction histidine kinase
MTLHEEHLFEEIKRYVGFTSHDEAHLRAIRPRVLPHAEAITEDFYAHILEHDGARAAITGGNAQVASLKCTLVQWLCTLFEGPWDLRYYERRARIGRRHVEINLPQQYMLTAVNVIRGHLARIVIDTAPDVETLRAEVAALDRIIDIELAVMLHTYREDGEAKVARSERLAVFGQLAASIAHELRNPLGVIESSSFLLRKRLGEQPEPTTRHLDKIESSVRRSNRIITGLLDIVRENPAHLNDVQISLLIGRAVDEMPATKPILHDHEDALGAHVRVDADQVVQILTNLFSNAREAAGERGEVHLYARCEGGDLALVVADTGPGIDPAIRPRLFELLVSNKTRGIGLGLALCRRLAQRNGGSIRLVEGPLSGAAFELRVPLVAKGEV